MGWIAFRFCGIVFGCWVLPIFFAWALIDRLRCAEPADAGRQRHVDAALCLLPVTILCAWGLYFIQTRHLLPGYTATNSYVTVCGLGSAIASGALAIVGRGSGRRPILAAVMLVSLSAAGLLALVLIVGWGFPQVLSFV